MKIAIVPFHSGLANDILFDKDNNIIATLNCYIDDIEANSSIQMYSVIKKDLSNFSNYSLSLNNN